LIGVGFDPDHDFVVGRLGRRDIHQRQFEFAALLEQRTQLKPALPSLIAILPFCVVISG
jgi:hypothetical protein